MEKTQLQGGLFIEYNIDNNGHAIGSWGVGGIGGDTTGVVTNLMYYSRSNCSNKLASSANYGSYSALWSTNGEVDNVGNFIQNLDLDSTSLEYVNCSVFWS